MWYDEVGSGGLLWRVNVLPGRPHDSSREERMNDRRIGTRRVRWLAMLGVVAAVSAVAWTAAEPRRQRAGKRARRPRNVLKTGQAAPDFELAVLKCARNKKGERVGKITKERVRLSSFRGRQSVVVFFSSYT